MFIGNLSALQQGHLLTLANNIINADGNIDDKETEFLSTIKSQCSSDVLTNEILPTELSQIFTTNSDKVSLLLELISIALADGDYHKEEISLIRKIASDLDISIELLQEMESWVKRQFRLIREANVMIGGK